MNPIEQLERKVRSALPRATTKLDPPGDPSGTWWLDIDHDDNSVTVEWRHGAGFGVSSSEAEAFEGSDERHATLKGAADRVLSLLSTGERTKPPRAMALPALRAARALSQQKLASVLGVKQAQISKLERQVNMRLGTLRKFVRALGGQLEIRARFKDESGDVIIAGPWAGAGTSAEDEDSTSGTPAARQKRRKPGKQRGGPGSSRRRR